MHKVSSKFRNKHNHSRSMSINQDLEHVIIDSNECFVKPSALEN